MNPATDAARIADFMRKSARPTPGFDAEGFVATLHPKDPLLYFNYAMPLPDVAYTPAHVAGLVAAFEGVERTPRLEYIGAATPGLEPLLLAAGFVVERRAPMMVCRAAADVAVPDGFTLAIVEDIPDLYAAARIQREAFGDPGEVTSVDNLIGLIRGGGLVALSHAGDEPAGAGALSSPRDGTAEVTGIGVMPPYRRRGLGAAITALLTREGLASGYDLIFLAAAGPDEARNYERAGFTTIGDIIHISRP